MKNQFVDAMDVCNEMMRSWFFWRKGHRKARWKKKWERLIKRSFLG